MKNSHRIFAALLALVALFSSCGGEQRKYVIGVDVSAYVCTQQGAMPPYPKELKERVSLLDF